ncbi:unnamed protein product [Prorocentrum cordatum]|uniref:Uncharacterized protein n=1 Tax=Prorocentrum cordatum TaxID=2364126 RepID=A0ABN9QFK8_9DINO|nr:unnamed protein product [Polarella glacialis]
MSDAEPCLPEGGRETEALFLSWLRRRSGKLRGRQEEGRMRKEEDGGEEEEEEEELLAGADLAAAPRTKECTRWRPARVRMRGAGRPFVRWPWVGHVLLHRRSVGREVERHSRQDNTERERERDREREREMSHSSEAQAEVTREAARRGCSQHAGRGSAP